MPFKGVTFSGQNVTPKDDGALYNAHYGDGILDGCSMAISGDDLVIQSGHFIAGGRVCHVDGATNVDLSTRSLTNGYIQVVMDYDISKPEGNQWNIHMPLIESATTTFPALTQDDINGSGTLYQLELAVVQISGGNLTSIYSELLASNVVGKRNINLIGDETAVFLYQADMTPRGVMGSTDNYTYVGKRNSGGSIIAGARYFETGVDSAILFGNGGDLTFRPNGVTDTTGQMWLDSDGYLHGGHPRTTNNITASVNIPVNTTKEIGHVQAPKNGTYMIWTYGDFNPDASMSGVVRFAVGFASPTSETYRNSHYTSGGAHVYDVISCVVTLNAGEYVYFNCTAPATGKVTGSINIILIN